MAGVAEVQAVKHLALPVVLVRQVRLVGAGAVEGAGAGFFDQGSRAPAVGGYFH